MQLTTTDRSPSPAARDRRSQSILIADDDADFASLLSDALEAEGHRVTCVRTGCDLVDAVMGSLQSSQEEARFSLVLSDVRMPRGTGMQALKSLRHQANLPPILLMTAFGSHDTHDLAMRLGAVGVINKPFDVEDLCIVVAGFVRGEAGSGTGWDDEWEGEDPADAPE